MPAIKINTINFNYELLGRKKADCPPLVLIGGYTGDINLWRPIADKMAASTQVLIFDNQGIGQTTEQDEKTLTLAGMANNIRSLLEALKLHEPIIAGFALGGLIAQKLALDNQSQITQLILLNTVMKFNSQAAAYCEDFCRDREQGNLHAYADLVYDTIFGSKFKNENSKESFLSSFVPLLGQLQSAKGQRRQVELLKICDSTNWVGKIRVPTMVISSAEDIFATPEEGKALAEEIKKSGAKVEYELIDESGHAAINEAPDELCAILDGLILQNMLHA